uniref:hypothetical protein n=1 Tax=Streptomyces sp. CHD11 TaxID=2741325 RepID=UPI00203CA196|nr:hypothetical protein [Streptomyces sp. CHD11]
MIWDQHDAAWRARLAAAADYLRTHGHLTARATKNTLDPPHAEALTALAPDWRLPHSADRHRKYHLLRAHLASGADPAALTRDTHLGGVKIGPWLARQLTTWPALADGQQLMTALGLTLDINPLIAPPAAPRGDRPALGALPPSRRPRPRRPRGHPRRRRHRQDRRLTRQSPHEAPLRPTPR